MNNICAFTGHRNLQGSDFDVLLLERVIKDLILTGTERFLCGMAYGFDLEAAECVLNFKKDCKINLTACLPCANQSERFSLSNKLKYEKTLAGCDEIITLSEEYYRGCMQARDRFLVDNCDVLVCFLRKNSGGTFYTVNYAKKLNKKIIEL